MAEQRPARNVVVTEEDLPLVFEHLGDLFKDARARGVAIAEVGKHSDREAPSTKPPSSRGRWTPPAGEPEFQPIERIGLVAGNLDRLASDSREMFSIVLEGSRKAAALDDETVERLENVLEERLFYLGVYREQLSRWRSGPLTEEQSDGIAAAEKNLAVSQELTDRTREKVEKEIRPGTIDRVLEKSDLELGMEAVLRLLRAGDL